MLSLLQSVRTDQRKYCNTALMQAARTVLTHVGPRARKQVRDLNDDVEGFRIQAGVHEERLLDGMQTFTGLQADVERIPDGVANNYRSMCSTMVRSEHGGLHEGPCFKDRAARVTRSLNAGRSGTTRGDENRVIASIDPVGEFRTCRSPGQITAVRYWELLGVETVARIPQQSLPTLLNCLIRKEFGSP